MHRRKVLEQVQSLQAQGKINEGKIGFAPVKSVGTDCIRADADELVRIGASADCHASNTKAKCNYSRHA